jgi:hypothetical protein
MSTRLGCTAPPSVVVRSLGDVEATALISSLGGMEAVAANLGCDACAEGNDDEGLLYVLLRRKRRSRENMLTGVLISCWTIDYTLYMRFC